MKKFLSLAIVPVAVGLVAPAAQAQSFPDELGVAAINAFMGAAVAGTTAAIKGEEIDDAVLGGAVGGVVGYGGKKLATADFFGAGLAGRQVNAVGASIVRNAGDGAESNEWMDRLTFRLGPATLDWYREANDGYDEGLYASLDLRQAVELGRMAFDGSYDFDLGASISHGVPVFESDGPIRPGVAGFERGGVVVARSDRGDETYETSLTHEATHVMQNDFVEITIGRPVDRWLMEQAGLDEVGRYVDVGATSGLLGTAVNVLPYDKRPHEREAYHFDGRGESGLLGRPVAD